jgi:hypothetical protein
MTELKKYEIYAGLGGSFGGANLIDTVFFVRVIMRLKP